MAIILIQEAMLINVEISVYDLYPKFSPLKTGMFIKKKKKKNNNNIIKRTLAVLSVDLLKVLLHW